MESCSKDLLVLIDAAVRVRASWVHDYNRAAFIPFDYRESWTQCENTPIRVGHDKEELHRLWGMINGIDFLTKKALEQARKREKTLVKGNKA